MQLTDQMKAEIDGITKYVNEMRPLLPVLRKKILKRMLTPDNQKYIIESTKQLSTDRIRLESLLCETDLKERDHLNRR